MNHRWFLLSILFAGGLWILLPGSTVAGTLEDNLSAFTDETAVGYLKPLQESFGQALNSNLFTTANLPKVGFHARLEFKAMSVFFEGGDETFEAQTGGDFTPVQTEEVPTVVGPGEAVTVDGDGGTQYVFPGGFDLTSLSLAVPQITLSGLSSEVMFRWIGFTTDEEDIGNVSLVGLGFRHSISSHLADFPLDLTGAVYYHKFDVESDLLDSESWFLGAQGSKDYDLFTLFGGVGYQSTSMTVEYTSEAEAEEELVVLDMGSEGALHLTAGAALHMAFFEANITGHLAERFGLSAGMSFGF